MLIVHRDRIDKAIRKHQDAASALRNWLKIVEESTWQSIQDVRLTFPNADGVKADSGAIITVFNIRGNNCRLLTGISYRSQVISIVGFMTHAEYDKGHQAWKKRL